MFYEIHYAHFVENQNARNAKIRHTERNRTIEDLLAGKKTCPEETIYQFGTLDEHASVEDLVLVVTEFMSEFHERFGTHVHLLDWALHLDESTGFRSATAKPIAGRADATETRRYTRCGKIKKSFSIIVRGDVY